MLRAGGDDLAEWAKNRKELIFHVRSDSAEIAGYVNRIDWWARREGYRNHVIANFLDCADPFLIGAAAQSGHVVVTQEVPRRSKRKLKIPVVCRYLGVPYENTFEMMRRLGARFT